MLNEENSSKFVTRKWNIVNDQSNTNYGVGNETKYNTEVLKSHLCDYNDAYILIRGNITVTAARAAQVAFKYCAPSTKCITMIDGTTIDDAEDLDLVMPMYNLIEYSSNYSETKISLCFSSNDETTNFNVDKSFKYKAKLLGNTVAQTNPNQVNGILKKCNSWCAIKIIK